MPIAFLVDGKEQFPLPPLPQRHRLRISPQAFRGFSSFLL
jgi:hypothetical protein